MAKSATKKSAFAQQAASDKYVKGWKDARKLEAGESFSTPTLPDGQYVARITSSKAGITKKKELYWSFGTTIIRGDHKNVSVAFYNSLEPVKQGKAEITKLGFAVITAKRLGYEFDDSPSPADFEGIAEELSKDKPFLMISCKNREIEVTDPKTKRVSKKSVCNWYVEKVLEDYDGESDVAADEQVVADDEGDGTIEKGDTVTYTLNGDAGEYKVVSVDGDTANIKAGKKTLKDIPLDELELVYENA